LQPPDVFFFVVPQGSKPPPFLEVTIQQPIWVAIRENPDAAERAERRAFTNLTPLFLLLFIALFVSAR
jgi:hypothetical protein